MIAVALPTCSNVCTFKQQHTSSDANILPDSAAVSILRQFHVQAGIK